MIPGKRYKPEDFVEAAWRRRWWIILPFVIIATATLIIAQVLPDRYTSSALLQVVPQQVPEDYVRSTVRSRIDEQVTAISQEILSRTQLERIIEEFGLYQSDRRSMIMEDIVERMRTRYVRFGGFRGGRDGGSFTVSFTADDPRTAMLVTERLAGLFIRGNLQERSVVAERTDQFLQSQLEEARRQLKEHESRLEAFRRANPGQMPVQFEANQQALQNTHMQMQALQESINRDRDQVQSLRRQIDDLTGLVAASPLPTEPSDAPMTAARALDNAQSQLKLLERRLRPEHPDVRHLKRLIADLEEKAAAEALAQPVSRPATVPAAERARATRLAELQETYESLGRRIAQKQDEEKRLFAAIATYRQRLEVTPAVESRLTELMRDYTTLQNAYQNLLAKSQEAKVSVNMERGQIGQQFKIIDIPRLPQRPTSPNRPQIMLMGAVFGLVLALGLTAVLEYRDTSLRTEDDVLVALSLPVLAFVPTMQGARQRPRWANLLLASSAMLVLVSVALLVWKLNLLERWVR